MKLHIGNLPKTFTESELKSLLTPFAEPTSLEIIKDNQGQSRGYAYAEFSDEHARAVIAGLDGKDAGGQTLKIGEARPRKADRPKTVTTPQA
ncbi:MAG: RNA-binding protein [Thermoanaerobaculia bacterium]|nr:RNA-binding protein [Thermoanaerobaculia bacterium]